MICPRCSSQLRINYDEPECLQCGFVDYDYTPISATKKTKSIVSNGTHYVLRYVGDFPSLADTLTHVRLERLRNRVIYGVSCPFCDGEMTQSSLSGKRREVREERYKCESGHRVSLTPNKNGSLGWK
jgi:Zn ribbon nucleic-acid-binding protein